MTTFLDLLIVVFMVLAALSLLALALMYLVKNTTVKKICFYIVAALGIYCCYVGIRVMWLSSFYGQLTIAVLMGILSVAALVVGILSKDNKRMFLIARIMATVALIVGMINAFV